MKGDPVSRREFDLFAQNMTKNIESIATSMDKNVESIAKSMDKMSVALAKSSSQQTEGNQIMREHIIHNDHKHEQTNIRLTSIAKTQTTHGEAIEAMTGLRNISSFAKKAALTVVLAALTAIGGFYGLSIMQDKAKVTQSDNN